MKLYYIIILLFVCIHSALHAQIKIEGRILDRENNQPVPYVVVGTKKQKSICMSNHNGYFSMEIKQSENITFTHLAYDLYTVYSDSLLASPSIYLNRHVINLNEIVVFPVNVKEILNKAILNLYKNYSQKNRFYMLHIEENMIPQRNREAYTCVKASPKIKVNNLSSDFNFEIFQLDVTENSNDFYFSKYKKPFWVELFPDEIIPINRIDNLICEMETCNENLLTVKLSPDNVNKEHYRYAFFTINIKDTVLTEIEVQSFPNSSDLFRTDSKIEWRINNHYYKIRYEYKNSSKECYIKEFMQIANATLYNIIPYDFSFKEISFEINDLTAPNRGKKLKNIKDIVLFKTDFPFTPDFWKQYFQ